MLDKQTLKPDLIRIINHDLGLDGCDISVRYQMGLKEIFEQYECDVCFLIENDDWYRNDYIERMMSEWYDFGRPDLFGLGTTVYYHIGLNKYKKMSHQGRASAFSTMCTKEILNCAPAKSFDPFFDMHIWKQPINKATFDCGEQICLGIKHGEGSCGGKAHQSNFPYTDNDIDLSYLKSIVDEESFKFYEKRGM